MNSIGLTEQEREMAISLIEKLSDNRCSNCNKEHGICTDNNTHKTCPFYIEPYDWCDGWDCALGRVEDYLKEK